VTPLKLINYVLLTVLLIGLFCLPRSFALEDGGTPGEGTVNIEAGELTYDRQDSLFHASKGVVIRRGDLSLSSESALYDEGTGEVSADGGVRIEDLQGTMEADTLTYNLDSGVGRLLNGKIHLQEKDFRIAGEEIEKVGEETFHISRGTFTTCEGESPSWKFGAKNLDVTLGRYASAKHVLFYLKDIPVLYFPYILFPVKTERESGFLIPRVGYSEKRGAELSLAYYQVMARNMDATFYLDYLSELGLGKGLEYRYIFGDDNEGSTKFYHVGGIGGERDRHAFDWRHRGTLPKDVRLTADVEYVSSLDYFEDFGEEAGEYNKVQAQSVLFVGRNWEKNNLTGLFKYTKDLEVDNDETLQKLPDVGFTAVRRRLGDSLLYCGLDSSATYFWRDRGLKGGRFSARPYLSAVFRPGGFLEVVPEVGYRERLYETSADGPGFEREGIYDISTRVSTKLHRIFSLDGGGKLRHSIEPEIVYRYIPSDDQSHLPSFDAEDRIFSANRITYALTNRLTSRYETEDGSPRYHDYLYLRLSQSYDIRESHPDPLYAGTVGEPFSDLRAEMILRPTEHTSLDVDTLVDLDSEVRFMGFNARGRLDDGGGNALSFDYRYLRGEREYLAGEVNLGFLDPFYVDYRYRYDLIGDRTLENVVDIEYRSGCWSLFLTLRDRLDDREYLVTFALSGLGRMARFGGGMGGS